MSCIAFLDSLPDSTVESRDGEKSIQAEVVLSSTGSKSSSVALEKEDMDGDGALKRKKLEKAVYQGAQVPKQGGEARSQRL